MTFQTVGWVDVFSRKTYRDFVIESFKYCQQHKGLNLFGYVGSAEKQLIVCISHKYLVFPNTGARKLNKLFKKACTKHNFLSFFKRNHPPSMDVIWNSKWHHNKMLF